MLKDLAMAKKNDYFPYLCRFMGYRNHKNMKHYNPKTTPMFSAAELAAVQPLEVKKWLCFCAYGTESPTDNAPLEWRVSSIEYAKKAISSFMPNHGEWNTQANYGNPTRSRCVLKFLSESKKKQVRKQGKAPCAKRDMKLEEFRLAMRLLQDEANAFRWSTAMKLQHALIARGDDIHHMKTLHLHKHPAFPSFALEIEMFWSKNVMDERDCPPQILLGAMDPDFCILLALAVYLETRLAEQGGNNLYLFATENDDEAPKRSLATFTKAINKKVFENREFQGLSGMTPGKLGTHSNRKFPATWATLMGALQHEIEVRGRWKAARGSRVSSRYINPEQPFIDARVAALLCVDGPVKYEGKSEAAVSTIFLLEHVVPSINLFFPGVSGMAEVLGPVLLWGCHEQSMADRIPVWLRTRILQEYAAVRPEDFPIAANPVKKIPIVVFKAGAQLLIDEIPQEEEDNHNDNGQGRRQGAAPQEAVAAGQPQVQQRTVAMHNGRQQMLDQLTAQLHSIQLRLGRLEERLSSSHGDLKQEMMRQLSIVATNVRRLQITAPVARRMNATGGVDATGRVAAVPAPSVQLSKRPKDLHSLWVEYTHGIGGLKAARDFNNVERGRVKQKYYRRKVFWDIICRHINAGWTAAAAVDLVYQVYGPSLSVTKILDLMLKDRKTHNGSPHPRLRVANQ